MNEEASDLHGIDLRVQKRIVLHWTVIAANRGASATSLRSQKRRMFHCRQPSRHIVDTDEYGICFRYRTSISMKKPALELLRGTLDLLILRTVELRPMHGVAIADRISQVTHGAFQVKAGSLFPALHRLEQEGWIEGEWQESAEGRRVRSYTLTRDGRRQLAAEKKYWMRTVEAMTALLEST
jgi:PadR family transcriptional regulator, regulatory protein PadR